MPTSLRETIRYVFLDRDGVINQKMPEGRFVATLPELVLCAGAAHAISRLNEAGIKVLVITNQRGVSLGLYSEDQLTAIHQHLLELLAAEDAHLDGIYYCPHTRDSCDCRKPKPGMLLQAFQEFPGANANNSIMVGDSLPDIQAGQEMGMRTVLIEGDPAMQSASVNTARTLTDYTSTSLAEFVLTRFF